MPDSELARQIDRFLDELKRSNASPHTLRNYGIDLAQFVEYFSPPGLDPPHPREMDVLAIREWLGDLYHRDLSPITIRRKLAAIRTLFKFLLRDGVVAMNVARLVRTPTVHTFHICPTPDYVRFCRLYPESSYVLLSEFQRRFFADVAVAGVVPNGIDVASFPFNPKPGNYLVYLGDFRPDKGPLESIKVARRAGVPIRLAGPESEYFHAAIKPAVDGRDVEYAGEVDHAGKVALLSDALAMIFPVQGLEACPLVLLESMACGTPVLSVGRGPVPEIVVQGVGGIYVDDFAQLAGEVDRVGALDRFAVRQLAEERFDASRMVGDYLQIFERVVARTLR